MRSGARIPNPTTPTSSSSPQKLTHTRLTEPSDTMKRTSTSSSTRRALLSNAESRASDCSRSEEHTSELQSRLHLVCRLLLEKKKKYEKRTEKVRLIKKQTE